ncbi:MAG: N-acetylmuramoyl-L-alanine amidase [Candidatus Hydrogenedentes bacterium]|nr:N-acetylmuramoyl-L-alanine amidase [Candidatus Hydrogenedentota bacterium]
MRAASQQTTSPFTAFGFRVRGAGLVSEPLELRARFSSKGKVWTPWFTAPVDDDLSDAASGEVCFQLICLDAPAIYYEWELAGDFASIAKGPTATVFCIDAGKAGPLIKRKGQIVNRSAWGCPDGEDSPEWEPEYAPVTHLVVHHTATSNSATDWPAVVRSIWEYHTHALGWGDIGYNYLCDPNGVIYEGRAGRNGVVGGHFSCQNEGTVGIALLGTFASTYPTKKQRRALDRILTQCARRNGIDPMATALHAPTGLVLNTICGHRDGKDSTTVCSTTKCPGHDLYESLPAIRSAVARRLGKSAFHE